MPPGAWSRRGRCRIELLLRHDQDVADGAEEGPRELEIGVAGPRAGAQPGDGLADEGRRVRHRADDRHGFGQRRLERGNGDAGGDTDDERARFETVGDLGQQVEDHDGLHGDDHDARAGDGLAVGRGLVGGGPGGDAGDSCEFVGLRRGAVGCPDAAQNGHIRVQQPGQNGPRHRSGAEERDGGQCGGCSRSHPTSLLSPPVPGPSGVHSRIAP